MTGLHSQTIRLALDNYIKKWLDSITDVDVRLLAASNTIVTGGAIASMLLGEPVNDFDIYFKDKKTALAVAQYYVKVFNQTNPSDSYKPEVLEKTVQNIVGEEEERVLIYMKSTGVAQEAEPTLSEDDAINLEFLKDPFSTAEDMITLLKDKKSRFRPVFLSDNAVTLSDRIQLIIRFWGDPTIIHRTFDFVHAMCWYDYRTKHLETPPEALKSLLAKNLIYQGSLYPVASLFRIRKFIKRGWKISAGQMLKIIVQLNGVDLLNPSILREQLLGVDVSYMHELISTIQNEKGKIDTTYLGNLIDTIFEES